MPSSISHENESVLSTVSSMTLQAVKRLVVGRILSLPGSIGEHEQIVSLLSCKLHFMVAKSKTRKLINVKGRKVIKTVATAVHELDLSCSTARRKIF